MLKHLFFLVLPFLSMGQPLLSEIDLLLKNKKYLEAEHSLNIILKEMPNNKKTLELLGKAYKFQGKWEEASNVFQKLITIDTTNANYQYKYGESLGREALQSNVVSAFFMINDVEKAFLTALKLDNNHIDAHWALIVYYTELPGILGGSIKKALHYSEKLKSISLVDYYLSQGYIFEYEKDNKKAEENYIKAVEVGGSFTCYKELYDFYEDEGFYQKAINTIEEANEKLQRNTLNYQLGKIAAAYNLELEKGEKSLYKYIKSYQPKDEIPIEMAYFRLAQIYRHKNDKISALKWIEKSLNFQPDFEPAQLEKELILKM